MSKYGDMRIIVETDSKTVAEDIGDNLEDHFSNIKFFTKNVAQLKNGNYELYVEAGDEALADENIADYEILFENMIFQEKDNIIYAEAYYTELCADPEFAEDICEGWSGEDMDVLTDYWDIWKYNKEDREIHFDDGKTDYRW